MSLRWMPALLLLAAARIAYAQAIQPGAVDCAALKLKDAVGPGDPAARQHQYIFAGTCRLGSPAGSAQQPLSFPVEATGTWNLQDKHFDESVRIAGRFMQQGRQIQGEVHSSFDCSGDPLITRAACNGFRHQNNTALDALSSSYKQKGRPLLVGLSTPAEALQLAARHPQTASGMSGIAAVGAAPHVTIRAPRPGQVLSGKVLHLDVTAPTKLVHRDAMGAILLEWEFARTAVSPIGRASRWNSKAILQNLTWNGHDRSIYFATADIPLSRLSESGRWRVRARTANPALEPTAWVEFSIITLK